MITNDELAAEVILAEILALEKATCLSSDLIAYARIVERMLTIDKAAISQAMQQMLFDAIVNRIVHFGVTCAEMHSQLSPYLLRYAEVPEDLEHHSDTLHLKRKWLLEHIAEVAAEEKRRKGNSS